MRTDMNRRIRTALLASCLLGLFSNPLHADGLSQYNVVWNSPSASALESMPCGGGDVGMNVWVEDGNLLIYLSRSGTFDELNTFPKLGRIRVSVSPNVLDDPDTFRQELRLEEGEVEIRSRKGSEEVTLRVWADVFRPMVHIDLEGNRQFTTYATYENWRSEPRRLEEGEKESCRTYKGAPVTAVMQPDTLGFDGNGIVFRHRNQGETAFDLAVRQQQLEAVKEQLWNPIEGLVYGGRMSGDRMVPCGTTNGQYASTPFRGWQLKSAAPRNKHHIQVALHTARDVTDREWAEAVARLETDNAGREKQRKKESLRWWKDFWDRSYIRVNPDRPDAGDRRWQVGRNYQVFRYQLACNAYGSYPTKFNGGLFTVDPQFTDPRIRFSPDFRKWGGGSFTAQNQRLLYWPLLKSGDTDMMKPQFDFYINLLTNAELRTHHYWGHGGASFTEQIENFGLPVGFEYGWKRPIGYDPGMQYNNWVEYQWDTVFEFCMMMVEAYRYARLDPTPGLPLMLSCLRFYDEHYQYLSSLRTPKRLDGQGKLVIYPGTALETYKMATNPTTTVTAMRCLTDALLELPNSLLPEGDRTYLEGLRQRIPQGTHYRLQEGRKTFAPAQSWERINNTEYPQLYTVFPWGLHHIDTSELDVARDTWRYGADVPKQKGYQSWEQSAIFCARLGLRKEAAEYTLKKMGDSGRRFPTWWGPGYDWVPDHNWGGSGMIGLQEMVMQCYGDKIYIGAGLPDDWDVDFKLHAPREAIVEGSIRQGKLLKLKVTPESRRNDVVVWLGKE